MEYATQLDEIYHAFQAVQRSLDRLSALVVLFCDCLLLGMIWQGTHFLAQTAGVKMLGLLASALATCVAFHAWFLAHLHFSSSKKRLEQKFGLEAGSDDFWLWGQELVPLRHMPGESIRDFLEALKNRHALKFWALKARFFLLLEAPTLVFALAAWMFWTKEILLAILFLVLAAWALGESTLLSRQIRSSRPV